MNCDFEFGEGNGTHRAAKCRRIGCKFRSKPLQVPLASRGNVQASCTGWPHAWEAKEWISGFGRASGLALVQYIRWRFRGSPLDQLPPGIPQPDLARPLLQPPEIAELFPGEDPTLLGNRIKSLTDAIGIPACRGCEARRIWLNKAHEYLRGKA